MTSLHVYVVDVETVGGWQPVTVVHWRWLANLYVAVASKVPGQRDLPLRIRHVDLSVC